MNHPSLPIPFIVKQVAGENSDSFTMRLEPEGGAVDSCRFLPGQFNMLYVLGAGEIPISISGDPKSLGGFTHTVREVGAVSRLLGRLKRGDTLGLRGPFGTSWPVGKGEGGDVLLIAGGIGLAPLRPVIYRILHDRKKFKRVSVLYGVRTPEDLLFQKELKRWREGGLLDLQLTADVAGPHWEGQVGVVPKLISRASFDPSSVTVMICGPEIMMRYSVSELHRLGVADDRVFLSVERNMKCAIGFCGHCQYGGKFLCKDGPVFSYERIRDVFLRKEY